MDLFKSSLMKGVWMLAMTSHCEIDHVDVVPLWRLEVREKIHRGTKKLRGRGVNGSNMVFCPERIGT